MSTEAKEIAEAKNIIDSQKTSVSSKVDALLKQVDVLSETEKQAFSRAFFCNYSLKNSTYHQLKTGIKAGLSQYKGGFFGISARRHQDMEHIRGLCDMDSTAEGRSARLAYRVYDYATKKIATGWLGRSQLRDNVLSAIETADHTLYKHLQTLATQDKSEAEALQLLAEENPSIIRVTPKRRKPKSHMETYELQTLAARTIDLPDPELEQATDEVLGVYVQNSTLS